MALCLFKYGYNGYFRSSRLNKVVLFGLICLIAGESFAQNPRRKIGFSGFVDADFATTVGSDLSDPTHTSGLEADLTTTVTFTPRLSAFIYTTLNDGAVPSQGAGNTWDDLNFDGVAFNWNYTKTTTVMVGELISGTGYFNYYRYKRVAAVVSEDHLRGAGFQNGGFQLQTGISRDSTGASKTWSTYAEWKRPINSVMTWTPSARFTQGVPGAWPFELGVTFEGRFENLVKVDAHFGMNYWNNEMDAGTLVLIEPSFSVDRYSFSATLFYNDKGEVPAKNSTRQTETRVLLDDFLFYVEPAYSLNPTFSVGLPLEYHNISLTANRDESIWVVPTLYVYPAKGAEWSVWAKVTKPLVSGSDGYPDYGAGSEISFRF
jgi:hypothetical protein